MAGVVALMGISPAIAQELTQAPEGAEVPMAADAIAADAIPVGVQAVAAPVGSFMVSDGPWWNDDLPTYTCLETCAMLFGGTTVDYHCSTRSDSINNLAWASSWGSNIHCNVGGPYGGGGVPVAEDYKQNVLYRYPAVSTYVGDWCGFDGEGTSENFCFEAVIPVDIDIKLGSDDNSINLCSNGAVPVAILGSETFDVNDIKTDSLRLAEATVKIVGNKDPHSLCSTEDVNDDGFDDLVCQFNTTELVDVLDGTSTSATVKGETVDGTPIEGSDTINIVKEDC
jgi:hypothetical protein